MEALGEWSVATQHSLWAAFCATTGRTIWTAHIHSRVPGDVKEKRYHLQHPDWEKSASAETRPHACREDGGECGVRARGALRIRFVGKKMLGVRPLLVRGSRTSKDNGCLSSTRSYGFY